MDTDQLITQLILHLIPDGEDRPLSRQEKQQIQAIFALRDDPETLQEMLTDTTQLSLAKVASPNLDDLIHQVAPPGIAVSESVRKKVNQLLKKKFPGRSS